MTTTNAQARERAATTRLQVVEVGERSLASYFNVVPIHILEALDRAAESLRGARILHLNATPYGGGVSEILRSGVPLLSDLGLVADWQVIRGDEPFFQVTKAIHNGLQGAHGELSDPETRGSTWPTPRERRRSSPRTTTSSSCTTRSPPRAAAARQG